MAVSSIALIARAEALGDRTALLAPEEVFSYRNLLCASEQVAARLLEGQSDLREARVAFLTPPGFEYAAVQWGIWRAGGIAVPLCVSHPPPELDYVLGDAAADTVIAHPEFAERLRPIAARREARFLPTAEALDTRAWQRSPVSGSLIPGHGILALLPEGEGYLRQSPDVSSATDCDVARSLAERFRLRTGDRIRGRVLVPNNDAQHPRLVQIDAINESPTLPAIAPDRRAMILYTSGTTSKPKGVVSTHANLTAQVTSLIEAWDWTPEDHILHVLPLHHIHGIVNVLTSALWAGARCTMLPRFAAEEVWEHLLEEDLTLFMAVPTIYVKLIATWEAASPERQRAMSAACAKLRLMVSGSAALPVSVLERWREISGHVLLERYGMTEIGMGLSNPLHGDRVPGHVGTPLPGVEVRRVDEEGRPVAPDTPGEIEVRGPGVFREYWRRPEATEQAFRQGWFRTGDVAVVEDGSYRILGRGSIDIIKTGGYKVSALEIEEVLRDHPAIEECAVVGVADPEWGERVCLAVVAREGSTLALESLREWAKERLAVYKVPSRMLCLTELPRNAMGKVTKPAVAQLFEESE